MPPLDSIHEAKVLTIKPFGAFVELHGYRTHGLIHISQLAQFRVEAVDDVVQVGSWVRVKVINVENNRVSVSMRCVDQQTGEELPDERGAGGGGGGSGGRGGSDALPELYSIHKAEVMKLESFGAFCALEGYRKQGLLHLSQLSAHRVEAEDLPSILEVGQDVFVKVIGLDDSEKGRERISLSYKLVSQSDGRDLDPTHAEAAADGERRKAPLSAAGGKESMASLMVPEHGGKYLGGDKYELVSEGEDDDAPRRQPPTAGGTYALGALNGGPPPGRAALGAPPAAGGLDIASEKQQLQLALAAQLLAKERRKKDKKEHKKERKKERKERKASKAKKAKKEKGDKIKKKRSKHED